MGRSGVPRHASPPRPCLVTPTPMPTALLNIKEALLFWMCVFPARDPLFSLPSQPYSIILSVRGLGQV